MTIESKLTVSGKYVPAAWHPDAIGVDFNGTDYCFITEADFAAPGTRELASALDLLNWVVTPGSPVTVPAKLFGMHSHFVSLGTSEFPAGYVSNWLRSHDAAIEWYTLQPNNKTDPIDWSNFDRWVAAAEALGAKPIYVVMGTPTWASSNPTQKCGYIDGAAAPPVNIADIGSFITLVAQRYGTRINHYEIWNEVNMVPTSERAFFWSGTWTELSAITKAVNQAVKGVNPAAIIIGPSSVGWGAPGGANDPTVYVPQFLQTLDSVGGAPLSAWIDWMACHLYYLYQHPSTIPLQFERVKTAMATSGIPNMPIIDSESGILEAQYYYHTDAHYLKIMKRHLVLVATLGLQASCWYSWDGSPLKLGLGRRAAALSATHQALTQQLAGSTITQLLQTASGRLIGRGTKGGIDFSIDV